MSLLLALLLDVATAGSCCVGSTSPVPTRLGPCERAIVGISAQGELGLLRWDPQGQVRSSSLTELGTGADLSVGVGLSRRTQLALTFPFRYTWRSTASLEGAGGGAGDARVLGRYNLMLERGSAGSDSSRPGVWLTAGARLPTGRSWTDSEDPLLADVTGLEGPGANLGVLVERTQHQVPWVLALSSELDGAGGVTTAMAGLGRTLGPRWTVLGSLGHSLTTLDGEEGLSVAHRSWVAGRVVLGQQLRWRAWLGLRTDLPIPGLGRDQAQLSSANLGVAWIR